LGLLWRPLLLGLVLFVIAALLPLISAGLAAARATFPISYGPRTRAQLRILVGFLYLTQPLSRLLGRLQAGLTPWRRRGTPGLASAILGALTGTLVVRIARDCAHEAATISRALERSAGET